MDTPFQWTKQIASHFGGTRNGLGHFRGPRDQDEEVSALSSIM